jgi:2'-5' RNA ligase
VYSIASIIDSNGKDLWGELEDRCKMSGLQRTAIPHFSWQTAESYEFEPLRKALSNICRNIEPFTFITSGLGIFPNERKILFLIIVKDRILIDLHEHIWKETYSFAIQPSMKYSPENWVPHISLNLNKLDDDTFNCALSELTSKPLEFQFEVSQIGLLFLTMASSGIDTIYKLSRNLANK